MIPARTSCVLWMLLATLAWPSLAHAEDWPFARGGLAGDGVALSPLPDEPELLWTYKADDAAFEATPVVVAGVAYLGDSEGVLHAVRVADGAKVWTKAFDDTAFISEAAVDGDRIVVADFNGLVRCLSTKDGAELWSFDAETEVNAGPTTYQGAALVTTEGGLLVSLSLETGKENWRFTIDAPLRCSATIVEGRVMLAGCDAKLHAIDASTGKEVSSVDIGSQTGNTAAAHDGRAYFGTEGGAFLAITAGGQLARAWEFVDDSRASGIRTAAAVNDKAVVFANQAKGVFALDPRTGQRKWDAPTRSRVEASPVIAGERVVYGTTRGRVEMLNLADGEEVWQYDAGGSFLAGAAVVDGRLLIANDNGELYCFGEKND